MISKLALLISALPAAQQVDFEQKWRVEAASANLGFGLGACWLSDLNGDGVDEFAVASRSDSLRIFDGATQVELGTIPPDPAWGSNPLFGGRLAATGDLDGDGVDDLIVSAWNASTQLGLAGVVCAYSVGTLQMIWCQEGAFLDQQFGHELVATEDVDGDGIPDLVVGGRTDASLYLLSGADGSQVWVTPTHPTADSYGMGLTTVQDRNGDGVRDLAFGTSRRTGSPIEIRSGVDGSLLQEFRPAWVEHPGFGDIILETEDLTGDGVCDLLLTESWYDHEYFCRMFFVDASSGEVLTKAKFNQSFRLLGGQVDLGPDLDHDGFPEVAVGKTFWSVGQDRIAWGGDRDSVGVLGGRDHDHDGITDYLMWQVGSSGLGEVFLWGMASPRLEVSSLSVGQPVIATLENAWPLGKYGLHASTQLGDRVSVGFGGFWLGPKARRLSVARADQTGALQFSSALVVPPTLQGMRLYFQALGEGVLAQVSTTVSEVVL